MPTSEEIRIAKNAARRLLRTRAQDLYPNQSDYFSVSDYQPIIDSFGTVIIQDNVGSYQGDTICLIRSGDDYGLLIFGWGSCSGCDSLQACHSFEDVDELIAQLEQSVEWFPSLGEARHYILDVKDWEGSFLTDKAQDFIEKVRGL